MNFPNNLKYTKDHEWIRLEGDVAYIGITDFAQSELGEIVYVDVDVEGETLSAGDIFGSIEAVKTVSDLLCPVAAEVLEVNEELEDNPALVNDDPYGKGWIIKVNVISPAEVDGLMDAAAYQELIKK